MNEQEAIEQGMSQGEFDDHNLSQSNANSQLDLAEQCDCGAWVDHNGYCPRCDY